MSILLTEQEVVKIAEEHGLCTMVPETGYKNDALWFDGDKYDFARAIQLALIEKMRKEPEGKVITGYEDRIIHWRDGFMPSIGTLLYRLPTPQELENESCL